MLTATLIALSTLSTGPVPVTPIRPVTGITEIRPGMIDELDDVRRDQVRFNDHEPTRVLGAIEDGAITWDQSDSDRLRLGGQDAPELILVRAFDSVFAIDPFLPLPEGDITVMRQIFGTPSLETDRTLFGRNRIDRTEELMNILERARLDWLDDNGFTGVRTLTNPNAEQSDDDAALPEPAGRFRAPADMPRVRSREQVRAEPENTRAGDIAAALFSGDQAVRISLPFGTAADVVASAERRNQDAVASR